MPFTRHDEQIGKARQLFSRYIFSGVADTVVDETTTEPKHVKKIHRVVVSYTDNIDPDLGALQTPDSHTINVYVVPAAASVGGAPGGSVAFNRLLATVTTVTAEQTEILFDPDEWLSAHEQIRVQTITDPGAGNVPHVQLDFVNA